MNSSIVGTYNTIEALTLGIEAWNSFYSMAAITYTTVSWNNTYPVWDRDSLAMFEYYSNYVKNNVIQNLTDSLDKDLGNVTSFLHGIYTNENFCEVEMRPKGFAWCGTYLNGALNTGIIEILKSLRAMFQEWITLWKDRRATYAGIVSVLNSAKSVDFLPTFNKVLVRIYYAITSPANNAIYAELADNLERLKMVSDIVYSVLPFF